MKTNKFSFKKVLCLLLILPMLLSLTACGKTGQLETEASCTVLREYNTQSSKAELTQVIGDQTGFDADGYRLTFKMQMAMMGQEMEATINCIFKENEIAIKMVAPNVFATNENDDEEMELYIYYKDGFMYADELDEQTGEIKKVKMEVSFEAMLQENEQMMYLSYFYNVEDLFATLAQQDNVTVTRVGNNFKVVFGELEIAGMSMQDVIAYINFDANGKLQEMQIKIDYDSNANANNGDEDDDDDLIDFNFDLSMQISMEVTLSKFNGNIEFPNLDGYELVEE